MVRSISTQLLAIVLASFAGAVLLGGCGLLAPSWVRNHPTAQDADEGYAVYASVKRSVTLPDGASWGRSQTRTHRYVYVTGVELQSVQDEVLQAARVARRNVSTKPVVVIFYRGRGVRDAVGAVRYPDGREVIRREEIP